MNGLFVSTSASQVLDFFVRAAVALALGAVIGVERQWRQRMAGLRTTARPTGWIGLTTQPKWSVPRVVAQ